MKVSIEVKNRKEGELIQFALQDQEIRAFVLVTGTLKQLPTKRAQTRVLAFVKDLLAEEAETQI